MKKYLRKLNHELDQEVLVTIGDRTFNLYLLHLPNSINGKRFLQLDGPIKIECGRLSIEGKKDEFIVRGNGWVAIYSVNELRTLLTSR